MNKHYNQIKSYLNLGLILFWILSGGGVLFVLQRNLASAGLLAYTLMLLIVFRPKVKNVLTNAYLYTILFVIFCMVVCYLFAVQPQDPTKYLYYLVVFLISGFICVYFFASFTYEEFLTSFYKGLNVIRIHAILSALLMPFLLRYCFIVSNDVSGFNAYTFKYLFFQRTDQYAFNLFGKALYRNQGLFWEPGVLQFYLNLFLFLQLYIFKRKGYDILITILVIISTYSTTAYGCMLLILSLYLLTLIRKKIFVGIFAIMITLGALPFFIANFQNKIQGEKQTSALVRLYDLAEQMLVIKNYFLTGVGLDDGQYAQIRTKYKLSGSLAQLIYFNGAERGSTNSVMFILGTMGIFMGGWWIIAYTKQQFVPANRLRGNKLLLTAFLLIGVSVEPLLLKPFFITFMVSGMIFTYIKLKYPNVNSLWKNEY